MSTNVSSFVAARKERWQELERLLNAQLRHTLTLDDVFMLDALYREVSADLATAQARLPNSEAHAFLNQLCARAHHQLYREEGARLTSILRFFARDFPTLLRRKAPLLFVSGAFFGLGILCGAAWVSADPAQAEWLVPTHLQRAILERRMWTEGLWLGGAPSFFAVSIAVNNLTVAIMTFATGVLLGTGPALLLFTNGLLIGSVFAACARAGMGHALLTFVCAHGPVELSTLVIAGAAGLGMGGALLSPGDERRDLALKQAAQSGTRMLVGAAPFLFAIGWVEGFVSPAHQFSAGLKAALGALLGAGFWLYVLTVGRGPEPQARSNTLTGTP
jgi:uncharacterized membrane protein SpoIIM required for sporulation